MTTRNRFLIGLAAVPLMLLLPYRFDGAKARRMLGLEAAAGPPLGIVDSYWLRLDRATDSLRFVELQAQTDSIRANSDSLLVESCRGGTLSANGYCSGRKLGPRVTVLRAIARRNVVHAWRIDSLAALMIEVPNVTLPPDTVRPPPPDTGTYNPGSPGNVTFSAMYYYASGTVYFPAPGVDTVTACVLLQSSTGERKLAWPAIRLVQARADSTGWTARFGNPLAGMCAVAMRSANLTTADSVVGTWKGEWFDHNGRRLWRPFFSLP